MITPRSRSALADSKFHRVDLPSPTSKVREQLINKQKNVLIEPHPSKTQLERGLRSDNGQPANALSEKIRGQFRLSVDGRGIQRCD